ncbi:hypothetical protein D3C86_2039750 [compost metagenome]
MEMKGAHTDLLRQFIQRQQLLLLKQAAGFFDFRYLVRLRIGPVGQTAFARAKSCLLGMM